MNIRNNVSLMSSHAAIQTVRYTMACTLSIAALLAVTDHWSLMVGTLAMYLFLRSQINRMVRRYKDRSARAGVRLLSAEEREAERVREMTDQLARMRAQRSAGVGAADDAARDPIADDAPAAGEAELMPAAPTAHAAPVPAMAAAA